MTASARFSNTGEPAGNPPIGKTFIYTDTVTKRLKSKDDAGTVVDYTPGGDVIGPGSSTDNAVARFDGTGGATLQSSGVIIDDSDNVTGAAEVTVTTMPLYQTLGNKLATGIAEGGILTVNANPAKFDISDGFGYVVDQFTDAENPVFTKVTWSGLTAQDPTFLATDNISYIGINISGTVVQQNTIHTSAQFRDIITLGAVLHPDNVSVSSLGDNAHVTSDYLASDLALAIGDITLSGNNFNPASTDLTVRKEAGETFNQDSNRKNNIKDPNFLTSAVENPVTWIYVYDDGTGGATTVVGQTDIDPDQYDDRSGTLASVANNKWTNQYFYFFPVSGVVIVQYGQIVYNSLSEAEAGASTAPDFVGAGFNTSFIRTILSVKKGASDLSDTAVAVFQSTGKFGLGGGGGQGAGGTFQDLQDTYDNSITPEILTDATRGALSVKRGTAADTDDVFDVLNGAGSTTFSVDGNGLVTATTFSDGTETITGGVLSDGFAATTQAQGDNTTKVATTAYADAVMSLPTNYVEGLNITYVSATTYTIEVGSCRDDSDTYDMTLGSTQNVVITTSGENGLDTGSEASNTFYYLWLIAKSSDDTTSGLWSVSDTAPTMPSGFDKKRLIGGVRNNTSSNFTKILSSGEGRVRRHYFDVESIESNPLSAGGATSFTNIDISARVSSRSRLCHMRCSFQRTAFGGQDDSFYIRPDGSTVTNTVVRLGGSHDDVATSSFQRFTFPVGLSSSQIFQYKVDDLDNDLYLYLISYDFTI